MIIIMIISIYYYYLFIIIIVIIRCIRISYILNYKHTHTHALTHIHKGSNIENLAVLYKEGAVHAIVELAVNHPTNADIAVICVRCLCNLARADYNAIMIVKQGDECVSE